MALTVRTDEQMEQALDALVETEGVSRQEVIRRSILDRYERTVHARRVAERTSKLSERWGDVLDRLGRS
jgi:predicted transcriptional regulator